VHAAWIGAPRFTIRRPGGRTALKAYGYFYLRRKLSNGLLVEQTGVVNGGNGGSPDSGCCANCASHVITRTAFNVRRTRRAQKADMRKKLILSRACPAQRK